MGLILWPKQEDHENYFAKHRSIIIIHSNPSLIAGFYGSLMDFPALIPRDYNALYTTAVGNMFTQTLLSIRRACLCSLPLSAMIILIQQLALLDGNHDKIQKYSGLKYIVCIVC